MKLLTILLISSLLVASFGAHKSHKKNRLRQDADNSYEDYQPEPAPVEIRVDPVEEEHAYGDIDISPQADPSDWNQGSQEYEGPMPGENGAGVNPNSYGEAEPVFEVQSDPAGWNDVPMPGENGAGVNPNSQGEAEPVFEVQSDPAGWNEGPMPGENGAGVNPNSYGEAEPVFEAQGDPSDWDDAAKEQEYAPQPDHSDWNRPLDIDIAEPANSNEGDDDYEGPMPGENGAGINPNLDDYPEPIEIEDYDEQIVGGDEDVWAPSEDYDEQIVGGDEDVWAPSDDNDYEGNNSIAEQPEDNEHGNNDDFEVIGHSAPEHEYYEPGSLREYVDDEEVSEVESEVELIALLPAPEEEYYLGSPVYQDGEDVDQEGGQEVVGNAWDGGAPGQPEVLVAVDPPMVQPEIVGGWQSVEPDVVRADPYLNQVKRFAKSNYHGSKCSMGRDTFVWKLRGFEWQQVNGKNYRITYETRLWSQMNTSHGSHVFMLYEDNNGQLSVTQCVPVNMKLD